MFNRDLREYTSSASDMGISAKYPSSLDAEGERKIEVCFSGERAGVYQGVILYSNEGGSVGVGSWIRLNIRGAGLMDIFKNNSLYESGREFLAGKVIDESFGGGLVLLAGGVSFVFLAILLLLLVKLGKIRESEVV
jgi:hypothetical protein